MRTILIVGFVNDHLLGTAKLEVDLPFAPTIEIEFEQSVWETARRPTGVSYSIDGPYFYVGMGNDQISKEKLEEHAEMYRSHGWEVSVPG